MARTEASRVRDTLMTDYTYSDLDDSSDDLAEDAIGSDTEMAADVDVHVDTDHQSLEPVFKAALLQFPAPAEVSPELADLDDSWVDWFALSEEDQARLANPVHPYSRTTVLRQIELLSAAQVTFARLPCFVRCCSTYYLHINY